MNADRDGVIESPAFVHLRGDRASLLIDCRAANLQPAIVHWGRDLGTLSDRQASELVALSMPVVGQSSFDQVPHIGLLPEGADGHLGRPALRGHRTGRSWSPLFTTRTIEHQHSTATMTLEDRHSALQLVTEMSLDSHDVLQLRHTVTNTADDEYLLGGLEPSLPLPDRVTSLLDFSGRWCRERHPQRHAVRVGTWLREGYQGRPGHDFPMTVAALMADTNFGSGEAWAVSLAWSGNHRHFVERLADGSTRIGAGELLFDGEIILKPGQSYTSPWLIAVYTAHGLDGLSDSFHSWLRSRPSHPTNVRPRPVTLNVWEAVYFNHDLDRLKQLADLAADIGVERFVLDDGWFHRRTSDTRGLGDWWTDDQRWPEGLSPLIDHVHKHGMEFGLWIEPEMINPDSDTFRAHPDWVLQVEAHPSRTWRNQHVIDLVNPAAFEHVLSHLTALLGEYDVAYLKWDHNRAVTDAGHEQRPATHLQTLAAYRLMDELKRRQPGLEIESCASGGGRIDLGVMMHADRVWASDTNDPLERQTIQFWTQLVLPPELVGSHVGPPQAHTTGRNQSLSFRAATALFGHAGIEWDITTATNEERAGLRAWIGYYKQRRSLLHSGRVVRVDQPDPAVLLHGVVAHDRSEALFSYAQLQTSAQSQPARITLPGLDPDALYRIAIDQPAGPAWTTTNGWPERLNSPDDVLLHGRALAACGLRPPLLGPEQAVIFHLTAETRQVATNEG